MLFLACGTVESSTVDVDILYTFVCAFDDRKRLYILKKWIRSKGKSVKLYLISYTKTCWELNQWMFLTII